MEMECTIRDRYQEDHAADGAEIRPSWMVEEMLAEAEKTKLGAFQVVEEAKRQQKMARELPSAVSSEGKFEYRVVQALIEIMTGRPTTARPDMIWMPRNEESEPQAMVLSSTEQFYYRVTPSHCPCKGWFYSMGSYGMGKCRHHTLAFPEIARENAARIAGIKDRKTAEAQAKKKAKPRSKTWASSSSPWARSHYSLQLMPDLSN
jgi:hypothetical protein